jgi:hypothetical protein
MAKVFGIDVPPTLLVHADNKFSLISGRGTKRITSDVRNSVANGGKPDIVRTAQFGRQ